MSELAGGGKQSWAVAVAVVPSVYYTCRCFS